jgi:hypothetical protein
LRSDHLDPFAHKQAHLSEVDPNGRTVWRLG